MFFPSHKSAPRACFFRFIYALVPPENRMRFSGGTGTEKNTGFLRFRYFFFFLYFPRLRRSRGKSVLFLSEKGPEKKKSIKIGARRKRGNQRRRSISRENRRGPRGIAGALGAIFSRIPERKIDDGVPEA